VTDFVVSRLDLDRSVKPDPQTKKDQLPLVQYRD
jgi:hypothetical protein